MRIAVVGATGRVGRLAIEEGMKRGHAMTGIVRDCKKWLGPSINLIEVDALALEKKQLQGLDWIVSAFGAEPGKEEQFEQLITHYIELLEGTEQSLFVVGGAGSLKLPSGQMLMETADFPKAFLPTAMGHEKALRRLEQATQVNWSYFSPGALFEPGHRTGRYQLGTAHYFENEQGESYASMEDYVVAMFDEMEDQKHMHQQVSVVTPSQEVSSHE